MRVFVTGATGWVGSATAPELLAAGHEVVGLARNDANAEALAKMGVGAHRGELADTDSLVAGAKACDGVIHLGFVHDWSNFMASVETDRLAVEAMLGALEGTGKPLVIASGTLMVAHGRPATETDNPASVHSPRAAACMAVTASGARGVRGSVMRLPPTVHGAGDHGFISRLVAFARDKGVSPYIGDGASRWPAVHRSDAARLFRLAVESAGPGSNLHAVAEEGVPMRAIAEVIGEGVGVPVRSIDAADAGAHFEFLAMFVGVDNPTSSAQTREALGWTPTGPDLLTDIRVAGYCA